MTIKYIGRFNKHFKERIKSNPPLFKRFRERVNLFSKAPNDPILKDHPLKGAKRNLRAFSVAGDIRVVYYKNQDNIYFIDVGTHNQVY